MRRTGGISDRQARPEDVSYGLNSGWEGLVGDYIGFWGEPMKGYATTLVQGSCPKMFLCGLLTARRIILKL